MPCDRKGLLHEKASKNYFKAKFDEGKSRWDLIELKLIEPIVNVLTFGAKKYKENSWKSVPEGEKRYFAAMMRHIEKYQSGETISADSGISHIHHAFCNLYFLIYFNSQGAKNDKQNKIQNKKSS